MSIAELLSQDYFYYTILLVFLFLAAGLPMGYLLIHRNLGLFSDAISHSLIPGLVGSVYLFGLSSQALLFGALVWGLLVSVVFTFLSGVNEKTRDATLVAISLFGISLGLVLNQYLNLKIDFTHLLFGSPLLADVLDLYLLGGVGLISLIMILFFWKIILRICIDPVGSSFRFGPFKSLFIFTAMTTILVVIGFQIFGVMLTTGLLILPNLAFDGFDLKFFPQIALSTFLTTLIAVGCFIISFKLNLTFSATFVLVVSLIAILNRVFKAAGA